VLIELPYPDKILWPNGRGHWAIKARETKKHREWAKIATLGVAAPGYRHDGSTLAITIRIFPKRYGPVPDRDGVVASCKAFLDGIADAIGANDNCFSAPLVEIAKERDGRFEIEVRS